jgi:hypothetical protein
MPVHNQVLALSATPRFEEHAFAGAQAPASTSASVSAEDVAHIQTDLNHHAADIVYELSPSKLLCIRLSPSVAKAEISEAELRLVESILPEIILAMTAQNDAS